MMVPYLIVEGSTDAIVMRALLNRTTLRRLTVMEAGGKSAALSLGTSIALSHASSLVAILVDADTDDAARVREQEQIFRDNQRSVQGEERCRLFLAVPSLEMALFPTAADVQTGLGISLTPIQAQSYPRSWKVILRDLPSVQAPDGTRSLQVAGKRLPASLSARPILKSLFEFLRKASAE